MQPAIHGLESTHRDAGTGDLQSCNPWGVSVADKQRRAATVSDDAGTMGQFCWNRQLIQLRAAATKEATPCCNRNCEAMVVLSRGKGQAAGAGNRSLVGVERHRRSAAETRGPVFSLDRKTIRKYGQRGDRPKFRPANWRLSMAFL